MMRAHPEGDEDGVMLRRHSRGPVRRRLDSISLNVLAVGWAIRLVWCLRRGRLPRARPRRR